MLTYKVTNYRKVHLISSSAEATVNYSNINVDYLNKMLQSKIFLKEPELPLAINKLVEAEKLEFFGDISQFVDKVKTQLGYLKDNAPSIYLVSDSSLRMGYATKIYEILNSEMPTQSGIIFVDPYLDYKSVMDSLLPTNQMKIYECKLNMNSTFGEFSQMMQKSTSIETIVLPEIYKEHIDLTSMGIAKKKKFYNDDCMLELGLKKGDYCWMKPADVASINPKKIDRLMDRLGVDRRSEYEGCQLDVIDGGFKIENGKLIGFKLNDNTTKDKNGFLIMDKNSFNETFSEKIMLDKMYNLATKLQEHSFQILNVEKRMDENSVYVIKCMNNVTFSGSIVKHSPLKTEIFCDNVDEYETMLRCVENVLGVYCL